MESEISNARTNHPLSIFSPAGSTDSVPNVRVNQHLSSIMQESTSNFTLFFLTAHLFNIESEPNIDLKSIEFPDKTFKKYEVHL